MGKGVGSGGDKVVVLEHTGSHLSPLIKLDLSLGHYAPIYKLTSELLIELLGRGQIDVEIAERAMKSPYMYYVYMMASKRLNEFADQTPEVFFGAMSHLDHIIVKESGEMEDHLKCELINLPRLNPEERKKICNECGKIDTGDCPAGEEFYDQAKDVVVQEVQGDGLKRMFNFDKVAVDTSWIDEVQGTVEEWVDHYKATYPIVTYTTNRVRHMSPYDRWKYFMKKMVEDKVNRIMNIVRAYLTEGS